MDFAALAELYGGHASIVRRGGRTYPAAVEALGRVGAGEVLRVADGTAAVDPRLRAAGGAHLRAVAERSPGLRDGAVLALSQIADGRLVAVRSGYLAMLATSDALRAEILSGQAGEGRVVGPLRQLAHEAAGADPLRTGRGRAAAIGVAVVATIHSGSNRSFVLGLRRRHLALDGGLWHVAPSGMLEPPSLDPDGRPRSPDPVEGAVRRELEEELGVALDATELTGRLAVLGLGYDLLRLRPELCLRLDLDPTELPHGRPQLDAAEFESHRLIELAPPALDSFWRRHPPEVLTPAAAAAVALAEAAG